jgi:hypothetical protein
MKQFKYLTEITMPQIKRNNETGFPSTKKRQHIVNLVNARELKFEPFVPSNTLIVSCITVSNNHQYHTQLEFTKVHYHENGVVAFNGSDGETHNIDKLNLNRDDVNVNCTCLDFRFRFAQQHYQNKSLVGEPPPPYTRVPGSNRPPVNPDNVLGACKHVLAVEQQLKRMRIV